MNSLSMKSIIEFGLAYFLGIIMPVLFYIKIVSAFAILDFGLALYCVWYFSKNDFSWRRMSTIALKLTVYISLLTILHYAHLALELPSADIAGVKITLASAVAACFMYAEMKSVGEKWEKLFGYNPFNFIFSIFGIFKTVSNEKTDNSKPA